MPPSPLYDYLAEAEAVFQTLKACYFEKYEEEILSPERANLRVRIRFARGHLLEFNEAITTANGEPHHLSYRYHFQDKSNALVFRYDNTPHFPSLETFPHYKHLPSEVIASVKKVIAEINRNLSTSN